MKHAGSADLALMGGSIPSWLFDRMVRLSRPIVEAIVLEYGQKAFLSRMSDPFWFQSFGAVIGMDWNSSGVTTAVEKAKIGDNDKSKAIKKLTELAQQAEPGFTPNDQFEAYLQKERNDAWKYGVRTVKGFSKKENDGGQLSLF